MSDMIDMYRDLKDFRALRRARFGVPCPRCRVEQPKRQATILEPGQRCRVHRPAYVDPRPELTQADYDSLAHPTADRATAEKVLEWGREG